MSPQIVSPAEQAPVVEPGDFITGEYYRVCVILYNAETHVFDYMEYTARFDRQYTDTSVWNRPSRYEFCRVDTGIMVCFCDQDFMSGDHFVEITQI